MADTLRFAVGVFYKFECGKGLTRNTSALCEESIATCVTSVVYEDQLPNGTGRATNKGSYMKTKSTCPASVDG